MGMVKYVSWIRHDVGVARSSKMGMMGSKKVKKIVKSDSTRMARIYGR